MPTVRNNAKGKLPNALGVLYTAPAAANSYAEVVVIRVTNTDTNQPRQYTLKLAGEEMHIDTIEPKVSHQHGGSYTLKASETIEGVADTAALIAYHISVVETTP